MSIPHARVALALLATLAAVPAGAQNAPRRPRVAILDVRALGIAPEKAQALSEVALTEASNIAGLDVIGRSDIQSMIGFEREKQMLGCSDDSKCMTEIAGAMGVDWILVGSLGQFDALYRLDLKLIDARRAKIAGRIGESIEGSQARLVSAVQKGVHTLLEPIAEAAAEAARKRPPPPPRAEKPPEESTVEKAPPVKAQTGSQPAEPPPEPAGPAATPDGATIARRRSVELRLGAAKVGGGSYEPRELRPPALAEADLAGGWRLNRSWSFHALLAYHPSTQVTRAAAYGYDALTLSGTTVSLGAAWAPLGNRYFSVAADAGVASMRVELQGGIVGAEASQRKRGLTVGVELRLDYPIGERWYLGARAGSRIALVGFDAGLRYTSPAGPQVLSVKNDVGLTSFALAGGYRF